MKFTFKSISSLLVLLVGVFIGASALQVYATGTWSAPGSTPPGGQVDAPINAGSVQQNKTGLLGLANLVVTNLNVASGTPGVGKVLTDMTGHGDVAWSPAAAGASVTTSAVSVTSTSGPHANVGWVMFDCPAGYVVTGMQISNSDSWSMHCSRMVSN